MNKGIIIGVVVFIIFIASAFTYFSMSGTTANQKIPERIQYNLNQNFTQSRGIAFVNISDFKFQPDSITIKKGQLVQWRNSDKTSHKIEFDNDPSIVSPMLNPGMTYSHNFTSSGTYNYHCTIHPSMQGKIIVE